VNLLIILVPLTLFLWMQAIYWFVFSRRAAHNAFIADRLGTDASFGEGALMRDGPQGAVAEQIANLLESAGEEPDVGPFLTRVMVSFFATFAVSVALTGSPLTATGFGLVACLVPVGALTRKRRLRLRRIEEQLPAALEMMIIAL
jgi:Flp pilus assembly protein TadB